LCRSKIETGRRDGIFLPVVIDLDRVEGGRRLGDHWGHLRLLVAVLFYEPFMIRHAEERRRIVEGWSQLAGTMVGPQAAALSPRLGDVDVGHEDGEELLFGIIVRQAPG